MLDSGVAPAQVEGDVDASTRPIDGGAALVDASSSPMRSGPLERCQTDSDYIADLRCREGSLSTPGYCTNTCSSTAECTELGSVCSASSVPAVCVLPCAGLSDVCPGDLQCQQLIGTTYRCVHPLPPPVGVFERCSVNADNCEPGSTCYRPSGSQLDGPGYCAPLGCSDCSQHQPLGVSAPLTCFDDTLCRFDCEMGTCPAQMVCEDIESGGSIYPRCVYPD
jgi:hypothetical protein